MTVGGVLGAYLTQQTKCSGWTVEVRNRETGVNEEDEGLGVPVGVVGGPENLIRSYGDGLLGT